MKKRFLLYVLLALGMGSCLIVDDVFESKATYNDPLDIIIKDSVRAYIVKNMHDDEVYLNYGFGELKIRVPSEVAAYEKWKAREGDVNFDQKEVLTKVTHLDSVIKQNSLARRLTIEHVFSVRGKKDSLGEVNRALFYLDEDFQVKRFDLLYNLSLSEDQENTFANFYYESPLIKGYTYEQSKALNQSFYQYFKARADSLPTVRSREKFMLHTLDICKDIMSRRAFDQQLICENMVKAYFKSGKHQIEGYLPGQFSELYQISEVDVLTGYYLFHTFEFPVDGLKDSMNVYVKFSPYYEIEAVFETDQAFEAKPAEG